LSLEDKFNRVARSAFAARMLRNEMGFCFDLIARILDCDSESARAHRRQIDYIVAHESGFFRLQSCLLDDLIEAGAFIVNTLRYEIKLQVARAQGDRLRTALRNETSLEAADPRQGYRDAVVRVKAFELDLVLRSLCCVSLAFARLKVFRQEEQFAVGENAVYVEQKEFDFSGAGLCAEFGHRGILAFSVQLAPLYSKDSSPGLLS
jgi:hypothetical protein